MNLNGIWQFDIEEPGFSREILVPFCPESRLSGIEYKDFMKQVWYRRDFSIPAEWEGKRIFLHFGAVDYEATAWLNGRKLGEHRGGYTPFSFEITGFLKAGKNELALQAKDNLLSKKQPCGKQSDTCESHGCWYTRTTGIWQTVWLEAVSKTFIKSLRITPDLDGKKVSVDMDFDNIAENKKYCCDIRVLAENNTVVNKNIIVNSREINTVLEFEKVEPWSPENPFLYGIELSLKNENGELDKVQSYFGIRKIHIEGKKVFLNNKPVFQRLVLDQGFYPGGVYTAPDDKSLKKDIEIAQALGFSGARLHQKVFEPRFLYWADKMGYLVWSEYPSWGFDTSCPGALEIFSREWKEAMDRDYNHPSIIGWCPFNETALSDKPEVISSVAKFTKNYDLSRPVIDTSGYYHAGCADIYDCHTYEQDPGKFAQLFEKFKTTEEVFCRPEDFPYKNQPYFVSEYGGIWWNYNPGDKKSWGYGDRPKTEDEFINRYKRLTETLLFHPKMFGFCYTQLYDVELEVNGLYTYERKPKFKAEIFKKINTQKAAIES